MKISFFFGAIAIYGATIGTLSAAETLPLIDSAREIFTAGGAVMWALLLTSMIGLTFGLERAVALRARNHLPANLIAQIEETRQLDGIDRALAAAVASNSTLGRVFGAILSHHNELRQDIEKSVQDELERALGDERRHLRVIGIAASIAPMLGLLGTVLGLITAFRQAAINGMDNPARFAGGIYQALYTTAFGLIIALFLLLIFHWLRGRVEKILRQVEDLALKFIHQDFYHGKPVIVIAETEAA